ncbi:dTDP-4-dehydrorhamnose reductase [Saccharicrinis sp. FJH54]|uniref:dTDP-4-dehydrorhamnose reductase n=1 Tax=Saccharicrinis sp. FJH54 TaxID=3344665 RepID=UPI0035D3EFDF
MKILVTGSNGQLGSELKSRVKEFKSWKFVFTDVEELDITSAEAIETYIKKKGPFNYLVNCAAYTAVDKAEDEFEKASLLNAYAPGYLAKACKNHDIKLIHISTDYVFEGKNHTPYTENDETSPNSVYGKTKLNGELQVLMNNSESIVLRTSWLYSRFGHNFVKVMQKIGSERNKISVVFDQIGTPTHAYDLADIILTIISQTEEKKSNWKSGIYHFSNEGVCSWYDFAIEIMKLWNIDCDVEPITSDMYPQKAPRPFYSVMNKAKIKQNYSIKISHWKDALLKYKNLTE